MRYAYPCLIERDLEEHRATGREAYVVTFRDVEPAITGGWTWPEALEMAVDCLGVALGFYVNEGDALPTPSDPLQGEVMISTTPLVAAKLAVYSALREQRRSSDWLAAQLEIDAEAARRLLDPRYRTHMTTVQRALSVLGRDLIVEDRPLASPPQPVELA